VVSSFRSRLADLNDERRAIATHVQDLEKAADIAESIEIVKGEFQRFDEKLRELLYDEQGSDEDAAFSRQFLAKQQGLIQNMQTDLRWIILKSKQARAKQNSGELLGDRSDKKKSKTLNQGTELTESLRRIKANLETENDRVYDTNEFLKSSTHKLSNSSDELYKYEQAVISGRKKITVLERRKKRDFHLMILGWCIFILTVLYILYRRIFYLFLPL